MKNFIACVSGASGIIGNRITKSLLNKGLKVRVLSRRNTFNLPEADLFTGDIRDKSLLMSFMQNAQLYFHCAAELKNETKFQEVNVNGTEQAIRCAEASGIKYFCHLSSVGVIGHTDSKIVDEKTPCTPQNAYEKSKWASEQLLKKGIKGCKVVILRPTNVVDENNPGILSLPQVENFKNFIKILIKGGENAHLVHAEDVSEAAIHLISFPQDSVQHYIVSCDHEPLNTVAGVCALYNALRDKKNTDKLKIPPHLSLYVPYYWRNIILRRHGNLGNIVYSSQKLMKTGYTFKLGLHDGVKQIVSAISEKNH